MKAFFIITRTSEMHKHFESFKCLAPEHEVKTYTYNHVLEQDKWPQGKRLDDEVWNSVKEYSPDFLVYVGACNGNMPSAVIFKKIRSEICPTVHFCSDAADEPWWPQLMEYHKTGSFSVQVALDGNKNWPFASTDITALTPIDPKWYPDPPKPHAERTIQFGFAGNPGAITKLNNGRVVGRRPLVAEMIQFGLKYRARTPCTGDMAMSVSSYGDAAKYMSDTRIMPNFAQTGSFERMHVKGRVVEAGLAGCMLLEPVGSPTPDWFKRDEDYLEYGTMLRAKEFVEYYKDKPHETERFGLSLRAKVLAEHSPQKFWGRIFDKIGIKA